MVARIPSIRPESPSRSHEYTAKIAAARLREILNLTTFETLGLAPQILRALHDKGYSQPTPIQAQTIGPALLGRDILGCAQTGTGKTAAFALPIVHRLITGKHRPPHGPRNPRVLVLSPTRELAEQIAQEFDAYCRHTSLSQTVIFGGVSQMHQVRSLQRGTDILVATPGRLMDLMEQGLVNLSHVGAFVLDEADRMLDMGFIHPIRRIAATLGAAPARQTLLFSATMPPEILKLATSLLHDPIHITVERQASTAALIEQSIYKIARQKKASLLRHLLDDREIRCALVFTKTKYGAERLSRHLNQIGISSDAIHGNKAQNQRRRALDRFRAGAARVLVATDVAARGLDVDGITHVFNYDLPMEAEAYVHRIGRTGRAGASGVAISFCDSEEFDLLRAIERLIGQRVPRVETPEHLPESPAQAPQNRNHARRDSNHDARSGRTPKRSHARAHPARSESPAPTHARSRTGRRGTAEKRGFNARPQSSGAKSHARHESRGRNHN